MPRAKTSDSQRKADAATHHDRYPARLHDHLANAVDAAEAIGTPLPFEVDAGTPDELVSRYGGSESPTEVEHE
jgi:hypothetical protein